MTTKPRARPWVTPLATVDLVVFGLQDQALHVLLVRRAGTPAEPYPGRWALPGGFVDVERDRTLEETALRKLREKTGIQAPYLEQLGTFGGKDRDPRGWSVTTVYFALVQADTLPLEPGGNTAELRWARLREDRVGPPLAFDHARILAAAVQRLRSKVEYSSLPVHLLPREFTLVELQRSYEVILDRPLEKSAFRRRMLASGILEPVERLQKGRTRPARLYRLTTADDPARDIVFFTRTLQAGEPKA